MQSGVEELRTGEDVHLGVHCRRGRLQSMFCLDGNDPVEKAK